MEYVVGVDIGGTFTDCVVLDSQGHLVVGKALSTPDDFSLGVLASVRNAAENLGLSGEDELIAQTSRFIHGCTVAENTLITRTGSRMGLITTRGFGDALHMMRTNLIAGLTEEEAAHKTALSKPEPFVARDLVRELKERIDWQGDVVMPLADEDIAEAVDSLVKAGVESIAVALLWSVANGRHEQRVAEYIREKHPQVYCSISSDVAPFIGEYERTTTTVFNAYIIEKIASYLWHLSQELKARGLRRDPLVMQAHGGVLGMEVTARIPVGTIESGPAAGVIGTKFLGDHMGERDLLAADMGGTTFKVGVIRDGVIERDYNPVFLRYQILAPKVWVQSIGSGGGSIAWVEEETRLLKVGPRGAGAKPGPVCYGLGGTEPTVSDADLVLGYLNPDYFLGGRMTLDRAAAAEAIRRQIAEPLGMTEMEAAHGIFKIANAAIADLIRKATIERGLDPRRFVLFAFGGAGPVHASRYAAQLGITKIVVPTTASVHGATGLVSSDVDYQYGLSDRMTVPADLARVNSNFEGLCARGLSDLEQAGFEAKTISIIRTLDMRYRFQVHEMAVPFPEGTAPLTAADLEQLAVDFDELYERAHGKGSAYPEAGREIITFRVEAIGRLEKPQLQAEPLQKDSAPDAMKGERMVFFEEAGLVSTAIYDFTCLAPGAQIGGPAIIETPVTTVLVNPNDTATVDGYHNIVLSLGTKGG